MALTVPPVPAGKTGWRKTLTGIGDAKGGAAVEGQWLQAGDVVDLPAGTLLLTVDKTLTGYKPAYQGAGQVPVHAVDVAAHLVTNGGLDLDLKWSKHYKTVGGAFGATTRRKLGELLAAHPAPAGPVAVVVEAQRPNHGEGSCRWCDTTVRVGAGHLIGHGTDAQVEHWETCPTRYVHEIGIVCGLCGVNLVAEGGYRAPDSFGLVMVREGAGRWEPRHAASLACGSTRLESGEEYRARQVAARQAEQDAFQARRAAEQDRETKKAARAAAKLATERAAAAAERARVEGLAVTGRTIERLFDKRLGDYRRGRLDEVTATLSDGTTTVWWEVVTYVSGRTIGYAEDYDVDEYAGETSRHTVKREARAAYQRLTWTPGPRVREPRGDGSCAECHQGTGRRVRHDSSGIEGRVCDSCDREPAYLLSFA